MNNAIDFNEEEQIKKDIERARRNVNNSPSETKPSRTKGEVFEEEEEPITKAVVFREILSVIINVLVCFLVVFLITQFIGQRTVVSGSSMEDTLTDGDNLIVDKISYRIHNPERFDVVVFPYKYEEDTYYIKRVIGLPGEWVYIDGSGNIYINDELLEESYGTEIILNAGLANTDILLGPDEYFVLGDNRNNSTDSRFEAVGNIKGDDIVGKAWLRVYPFKNFGLVDNIE
ncbi:signal peptidase I [Pseudobutyrivibrio xylanivorans DSM 14809]|uniref:Signal peptidase I n=1 Tax=Pseudobutyrivibrio xylanivorans DSM 14809 TaxID=1123012 RepID=A0A1M6EBS1_PSEXY|nr:signal peptidase I [Pseudobutyrivibrio xylanivorans]SHI82925.1 signal peptidase I [Pseudobutyrivibrio xylanivorans DSM 14809]